MSSRGWPDAWANLYRGAMGRARQGRKVQNTKIISGTADFYWPHPTVSAPEGSRDTKSGVARHLKTKENGMQTFCSVLYNILYVACMLMILLSDSCLPSLSFIFIACLQICANLQVRNNEDLPRFLDSFSGFAQGSL